MTRIAGTLLEDVCIFITSRQILLRRNNFQTKVVEKIKTNFTFNNFFLEHHAINVIVWKNVMQQARPQMKI